MVKQAVVPPVLCASGSFFLQEQSEMAQERASPTVALRIFAP